MSNYTELMQERDEELKRSLVVPPTVPTAQAEVPRGAVARFGRGLASSLVPSVINKISPELFKQMFGIEKPTNDQDWASWLGRQVGDLPVYALPGGALARGIKTGASLPILSTLVKKVSPDVLGWGIAGAGTSAGQAALAGESPGGIAREAGLGAVGGGIAGKLGVRFGGEAKPFTRKVKVVPPTPSPFKVEPKFATETVGPSPERGIVPFKYQPPPIVPPTSPPKVSVDYRVENPATLPVGKTAVVPGTAMQPYSAQFDRQLLQDSMDILHGKFKQVVGREASQEESKEFIQKHFTSYLNNVVRKLPPEQHEAAIDDFVKAFSNSLTNNIGQGRLPKGAPLITKPITEPVVPSSSKRAPKVELESIAESIPIESKPPALVTGEEMKESVTKSPLVGAGLTTKEITKEVPLEVSRGLFSPQTQPTPTPPVIQPTVPVQKKVKLGGKVGILNPRPKEQLGFPVGKLSPSELAEVERVNQLFKAAEVRTQGGTVSRIPMESLKKPRQ